MSGPETISVVAGGWSLGAIADQLHRLPGYVIAVNDSGVRLPRVDEIVSMDRLWTEYRWGDLCRLGKPTFLRAACLPNIKARPPWLQLYLCDWQSVEPSGIKGMLNGTNSGLVALNRARVLEPDRVILWGFDMGRCPSTGRTYWHEPYPWSPKGATTEGKYRAWAGQFDAMARSFAAAGIEVLNASPKSRIPAFTKVKPEKVLV
jgi:hypothetical protein